MSDDPYYSVLVTVRPNLVNVYVNGLPITEERNEVAVATGKRKDYDRIFDQLHAGRLALKVAISALIEEEAADRNAKV